MAIRRVTPKQAHELIVTEEYVYVDVRSVPEFEGGRPHGAHNIPWSHPGPQGMQPNPDFLAAVEARFARDAKLIVGCLSGGRSARACAALEQAGYVCLADQISGWGGSKDAYGRVTTAGWHAEGLPTMVGPDPERGYRPPNK